MDQNQIHANRDENKRQSVLLIGAMSALLAALGWAMLGLVGAAIGLGIVALGAAFGPRASPALVLRMYKAQPLTPTNARQIHDIFQALVARGQFEHPPSLHYVPSRMPNAFAVGSGTQAAVALTDGIIRIMNGRELAGVLAHELSHIRHEDTQVMGLADIVSRTTGTLSSVGQIMLLISVPAVLSGSVDFGWRGLALVLLLIAAPSLTTLLQLALSRSREFNADMGAVELTGDPQGLASALNKLARMHPKSWTEKLLPGRRPPDPALLRSHPPTAQRVQRLLSVAAPGVQLPVPEVSRAALAPADFQRVRGRSRWHISGLWY